MSRDSVCKHSDSSRRLKQRKQWLWGPLSVCFSIVSVCVMCVWCTCWLTLLSVAKLLYSTQTSQFLPVQPPLNQLAIFPRFSQIWHKHFLSLLPCTIFVFFFSFYLFRCFSSLSLHVLKLNANQKINQASKTKTLLILYVITIALRQRVPVVSFHRNKKLCHEGAKGNIFFPPLKCWHTEDKCTISNTDRGESSEYISVSHCT